MQQSRQRPASAVALTLTEKPTLEQMQTWWETMWGDPTDLTYAFSDLMPRTLPAFLEYDVMLALVVHGTGCVAAVWLHDLEREGGQVIAGWVGGWVHPMYRGAWGLKAAQMALASFQAHGVQHIHAAVHVANRASRALIAKRTMLGFTRVMVYPAFLPYANVLADYVIFTMHPQDVCRARRAANRRARTYPHPVNTWEPPGQYAVHTLER